MSDPRSRLALALGLAGMIAAGPAVSQELAAGSGTARAGSGSAVQAGSGSAHQEPPAAAVTPQNSCTRCGERTYGTSIQWEQSVPEAARRAQADQKLVFVLHVSGHFENAGYT